MTLSVVMPVYNSAPWLKRCLESVLGQTLRDIEVIAVNDGSTDASLEILNAAAAKDARLKVVTQPNAGQGAARNRGLELATGRFVHFMDSDDALADPDAYESLVHAMVADGLDMLFFDASTAFDEGVADGAGDVHTNDTIRKREYGGIRNGEKLFAAMERRGEFSVSPCLYVLRREFIEANRLRFPEGIIHEDDIFTLKATLAAKRTMHLCKAYYVRRVHAGTTVTGSSSARKLAGRLACMEFAEQEYERCPAMKSRLFLYRWLVRRLAGSNREDDRIARAFKPMRGERLHGLARCIRENGMAYTLRRAAARIFSKISNPNKGQTQ